MEVDSTEVCARKIGSGDIQPLCLRSLIRVLSVVVLITLHTIDAVCAIHILVLAK